MSSQTSFKKDPDEVLDYGINWREKNYLDAGENIQSSSWAIAPSGLTKSGETYNNSTGLCSFVASGGTAGTSYTCTNTITTSESRTCVRSIIIVVEDR